MPLNEFTEEAYQGLAVGREQIAIGGAKDWFDSFEPQRQKTFHEMVQAMSNYGK